MSETRVWKYQGTGNDFVMTLDLDQERPLTADEVRALCDRRFGIGADGSIRVTRGSDGRPFMDYRNADGSVAEMCGNGLRCVAMLLRDAGEATDPSFEVETRAGIRQVTFQEDGRVTVDMGEPNFTKAAIPMRGPAWETYLDESLDLGGGVLVRATAVSMGNPHLVLFLEDDPERFHVSHIGAVLERDERFPEGTNVEFARVGAGGDRGQGLGAGERGDAGLRERRVRDRGGGARDGPRRSAFVDPVPRRSARGRAAGLRLGAVDGPGGAGLRDDDRRRGARRGVVPVTDLAERLAARTEALVAVPSESRNEAAILAMLREHLPASLTVVDDEDSVLLALPERRPGAPLVLLAGHVDTVPIGRSAPGRREGGTIHGRGAADMKAGLAVLLEIAEASAGGGLRSDLDVGLVCFGREELPFGESALMPLFDRRPEVRETTLAIVMEPTDNALELGCLGNLTRHRHVRGGVGAHRASVARQQRDPRRDRRAGARRRPAGPRRRGRRPRVPGGRLGDGDRGRPGHERRAAARRRRA